MGTENVNVSFMNFGLLRSESKHSIANIIVLPALLLFIVQTFVIIPADTNPAHTFPARTFVANIALWLLIWFGHNIKASFFISIMSSFTGVLC
jgi:hypothetical protein